MKDIAYIDQILLCCSTQTAFFGLVVKTKVVAGMIMTCILLDVDAIVNISEKTIMGLLTSIPWQL